MRMEMSSIFLNSKLQYLVKTHTLQKAILFLSVYPREILIVNTDTKETYTKITILSFIYSFIQLIFIDHILCPT